MKPCVEDQFEAASGVRGENKSIFGHWILFLFPKFVFLLFSLKLNPKPSFSLFSIHFSCLVLFSKYFL